jgi:hypothetical protein
MRLLPVLLALLATSVLADEAPLRPSARLIFKQPDLLRAGQCVMYKEGGAGWVLTEPVYFLRGEVLAGEVRARHLGVCPQVPGKTIENYSRDEFIRLAKAHPCVSEASKERDEQLGVVHLRVTDWETPHARKAENAGRLYRGTYLDQHLEKGLEIEIEADMLGTCEQVTGR